MKTAVTVGECLGDPQANWYRDSTPLTPAIGSPPVNPPPSTTTSTPGSGIATGTAPVGPVSPDDVRTSHLLS